MRLAAARALLILFAASSAFAQQAAPKDEALRAEILKMYEVDQAVRAPFLQGRMPTEAEGRAMLATDEASTRRLLEIIERYGFPGPALVGKEAADKALVFVLHSPSLALKRRTLSYLKRAVPRGEAQPDMLANLTDIILHDHLHKPQIYGTRFDFIGGKIILQNVKDPAHLDERRWKLGLPPIRVYARELAEMYKMPLDESTLPPETPRK